MKNMINQLSSPGSRAFVLASPPLFHCPVRKSRTRGIEPPVLSPHASQHTQEGANPYEFTL